MQQQERISAFVKLGKALAEKLSSGKLESTLHKAYTENQWFTVESSQQALEAIIKSYLDEEKLNKWLSSYDIKPHEPKTVGIVMAGNVPLVGWHDLMAVVLSGNKAMVKLSSKDKSLPEMLIKLLLQIEPKLASQIEVAEKLQGFGAVIATGSNNTARYFEYYFSKYRNIIRKNRSSVAILTGQENEEEIKRLGADIFSFFGLGCRNVSKLYIPPDYNLSLFFEPLEGYSFVADHNKYRNNYDYYKSIYLINREEHFDNGFLLLKKSNALASAVSVMLYEHYTDVKLLSDELQSRAEEIQCVVGAEGLMEGVVPFGKAQQPELWDYADNVDTMQFLLSL